MNYIDEIARILRYAESPLYVTHHLRDKVDIPEDDWGLHNAAEELHRRGVIQEFWVNATLESQPRRFVCGMRTSAEFYKGVPLTGQTELAF